MTTRNRPGISVALFLACAIGLSLAQQSSTISQESDQRLCSNIVALSGNLNVNCSSLTPAQQKILASIPRMLNKIIANQLDTDAIMAKLDEMSKERGTAIVQNCPSGICNNGPNNGSQTVINNAPAGRHLTPSQIAALGDFAKSLPANIWIYLRSTNDADSVDYVSEIKNALSRSLTIELIPGPKGAFVVVQSQDSPTFPFAQQLVHILTSTGTRFSLTQGHVNPNEIFIFIGPE